MPESTEQKAEIIYAFDGYCGWCWGMSTTISRLAEDFADRFQFSAVCGGLITGGRIGPLGKFGEYIERTMPRVEEMTGAIFSTAHRALIKDRTTILDSRIPAAAFTFILKQHPETDTMALAADILTLNFKEGLDILQAKSYVLLMKKYQADADLFATDLSAGRLYGEAEKQFAFAHEIGAEAFPAIIYSREGQYFPLCQGYQNYENLAHALDILHREPPPITP